MDWHFCPCKGGTWPTNMPQHMRQHIDRGEPHSFRMLPSVQIQMILWEYPKNNLHEITEGMRAIVGDGKSLTESLA